MSVRTRCSVSLDLDDLWSYLMIHGNPAWEEKPSFLDILIPRVLELLSELGLEITVFVVGSDAARKRNHRHLRSIVDAGHQIGNHSFRHESWLQQYSRSKLEEDIQQAQEAIQAATGVCPKGFRGPGFSWSSTLFEVLVERGFLYDASTFPTFLGPVSRAYYFQKTRLSGRDKEKRKELFGGFREGFRPSKAFQWQLNGERQLLEIPVTTLPFLKTPFHLSYLLYLTRISRTVADLYLRTAILLCRVTRTEPSFLLHPLDFLGGDEVTDLDFFPAMDLEGESKVDYSRRALRILRSSFDLCTMEEHAESLLHRGGLRVLRPGRSR